MTGRGGPFRAGFTLLELVFALAILAILAAIFLPIGLNPLRQADIARANGDIQELAMGLTRFFVDLSRLPACDATDCSRVIASGDERNNGLRFLAVGEGRGSLVDRYPREPATLAVRWNLVARGHPVNAAVNNATNHLAVNDPNVDGRTDQHDYPLSGRSRWRGPYLFRGGPDPWGNAYIVSVGAMEAGGEPIVPGAKAWIISAGPNGVLETPPDALEPGGDDLGLIMRETPIVP